MSIITQQKQKLAFLGSEGTYSHKAAKDNFGDSVIYIAKDEFNLIIEAIVKDEVDMGIIPFFNPYEEHIRECQEMLFETDLIATRVIKFDVDLHLASNRLKLDEIKIVYSKDHVFKQCDLWLKENLSSVVMELSSSTVRAAEEIKNIPGAAVICSLEAAARNDLDVLAKNIENVRNFTLFFVIQKIKSLEENWRDYSLFCFRLQKPEEGTKILDILQKHNLRCSQKWNCPHTSGEYLLFFLECFGRYRDLDVVTFETECKKYFASFKLIGSFGQSITKFLAKI